MSHGTETQSNSPLTNEEIQKLSHILKSKEIEKLSGFKKKEKEDKEE